MVWNVKFPHDHTMVMRDIALVQADLRPDLAKVFTVNGPTVNKKLL